MTSVSGTSKSTVILADKSIFDIALRSKAGIQIIDLLRERVAPVTSTLSILDSLDPTIEKLEQPVDAIWRNSIDAMKREFIRLTSISEGFHSVHDNLSLLSEEVAKGVRHFNPKVDRSEIELLAAAAWLRKNSSVEPIVASDDGDVLRACHLVASFFGLVISVLSSFELIRLGKNNSLIPELCNHFSLEPPSSNFDEKIRFAHTLVDDVDRFARRGFLSFHMILPANKSCVALTSKRKSREVKFVRKRRLLSSFDC